MVEINSNSEAVHSLNSDTRYCRRVEGPRAARFAKILGAIAVPGSKADNGESLGERIG